ncbi:hypothetical protein MUY27_11980 [Mucilaginibacter sp. RS28]|uniref:Uncharacterized protein n=1 Tax=Mucilaginibacter straminoryzae TaxID=2932774 RepID=A0A9X1X3S5_9SPHI|nr:hypothetical protein [Mucilaginibacter straminoryzae]MCJ8210428.1 hypothetical protein [Mucilaginibacter straminoryzae]
MKIKHLTCYILLQLVVSFAFAQRDYDLINGSNIYLNTGTKMVPVYSLKKANINKLLGKPLKIKKVDNEISESIVKEYVYPSASILFEDANFNSVDMRKTGWLFVFKTAKGFGKPIGIGSPITLLKDYFPNSWRTRHKDGMSVFLAAPEGEPVDVFISFSFKNGKISWILLTPNES